MKSKYVNLLVVLFTLCTFMIVGCSQSTPGTPSVDKSSSSSKSNFKVAMVTDKGGLGDQSFNDSAYRGLKQAEKELGIEIKVVESRSASDYEPNLQSLADEGYNLVFAIGYL